MDYASHKFNTTWNYKETYLLLGYGYSKINGMNYDGVSTKLMTKIPYINTRVSASFNYWFDYIEYSVNLYKTIPKTYLNLGLGYEQLSDYREININLNYKVR